jgi:ADP-heptose:LPS heptosyltransferase
MPPGRRVLVVRLDSAGDVLLAGPAVRSVAAAGAQVSMLVARRAADAAALLPGVAQVLTFDAAWIVADPPPLRRRDLAGLVGLLARRRFDEALILTSFHQSALPTALLLRLAGVGRITAWSEDFPGTLLDVRVPLADDLHEAERAAAIARAAGFPDAGTHLQVRPELPDVAALVGPGRYVVVHPGTDAPARQWPADAAREAVAALAAEGHRVVVTGGPDEAGLTAAVARDAAIDLGGRTGWAELAAVLRGAAVVVVANTGPAHLAAAVGTPVVSLFAPTVPLHRWGPYCVPAVVLGDQQAPCAGTRARTCPVPGHPCLALVDVAEVLDAVEVLLRRPVAAA